MLQMKMNIFLYLLHNIYFNTLIYTILTIGIFRHGFPGGGGGGCTPPEMICTPRNDLHPPEMICTPPPTKAFGTPANYIYFDLIVSYLIILTTKFVKLPILWSQISPCRPRKHILLNFFLGLSGRCHHTPAKASSSTPRIFIHPPERKCENPSLGILGTTRGLLYLQYTEA